MNTPSTKKEMQFLIQQCINNYAISDSYESLKIYKNTFGCDNFTSSCEILIRENAPLVSLICLNSSNEHIDDFISLQHYPNLEIVRVSEDDSYSDIIEYISMAPSKYICFFEENHTYNPDKIFNMVLYLEKYSDIDVVISPRNFIDSKNTIISHAEYEYQEIKKDSCFDGKTLLEYCINENKNLYGNLSTIMVAAEYAKRISWDIPNHLSDSINRLSLLYQFLLYGKIKFIDKILVSTIVQDYEDTAEIKKEYKKYIESLSVQKILTLSCDYTQKIMPSVSALKSITFFYTDMGEYYNLKPIADEAIRRGYQVEFTQNPVQKAEIGVYCQHVCYPENSKFSVILLHDLAQGHNRWPNIWEIERWDKFDIGIVPGKSWADRWAQCACQDYVNPKYGTYELGYPKSDLINSAILKNRAEKLRLQMNLKYNFSVLYAPSWENDEKEDDFIRALASLKINLLIKQSHWPDMYKNIIHNINEMRALHEYKYENVYYIEPEESILTALELCDMVVSEESSVMSEALMFGKPSIAVIDWLIPDTIPSRFASVPIDYVLKCKKVELREYVEKMSSHSIYYNEILEKGNSLYSNQGHCCKDILNAIQYYTGQKTDCEFLNKRVSPKYTACSMWG